MHMATLIAGRNRRAIAPITAAFNMGILYHNLQGLQEEKKKTGRKVVILSPCPIRVYERGGGPEALSLVTTGV